MVKHLTLIQIYLQSLIICLVFNRSQQQKVECGKSKFPMESGNEAEPGEFPWMVHLFLQQNGDEWFNCSGTLISDLHVLTAAHCVHKENRLNSISRITLGFHGMQADSNSTQIVDWKTIVIPAGSGSLMENDIAIITLTKPAKLTDYVQPICLPFISDYVNESVVLTGWGQYNDSAKNLILYKSETTVLSSFGTDDQCQKKAGIGPFSGDRVICTDASISRQNVGCGSLMNYYNQELDRWFVLGVAGKVEDSTGSGSNKPILFTRVTSQLNFIRKYSGVTSPWVNATTVQTTEGTASSTSASSTSASSTSASSTSASSTSASSTSASSTSASSTSASSTSASSTSASSTSASSTSASSTSASSTSASSTSASSTSASSTSASSTSASSTSASSTSASSEASKTSKAPTFTCAGKEDGYYPDPLASCSRTFYRCSDGRDYSFICSEGLVYGPTVNVCDWPGNVAGCNR
ncbi:chymotrypsin-like elastase family member 2A [Daphnia carinata]|uniref:chymotrypsin-like elastase family member 2A n=1 Tax=Daphnia carinata TaxID=120202 RepID=UPI00257A44CF|nr:chymotrypsin-like elastase family member 2A [Daphnia carinata]